MNHETFWVVWCPQGGAPTYKHPSESAAIAEATRLARMNPGNDFHVLASVGTARRVDVEFVRHDIPF